MTAASVAFKNQGVKGFISPDISPQDVDMGNIAIMGEQAAKVKKLLASPEYSGADTSCVPSINPPIAIFFSS